MSPEEKAELEAIAGDLQAARELLKTSTVSFVKSKLGGLLERLEILAGAKEMAPKKERR